MLTNSKKWTLGYLYVHTWERQGCNFITIVFILFAEQVFNFDSEKKV